MPWVWPETSPSRRNRRRKSPRPRGRRAWQMGPTVSDSLFPSFSFIQNPDFWLSCKNHISCFWDPKIVKQILCCFLRWLVFNKNIKWIMFSEKLFIKDLILLFMDKCISLVLLISLLWKFYGGLCMALECSDNYFMIFGALQLWYVICVWNMACFFN
jgi:hypothetical protein